MYKAQSLSTGMKGFSSTAGRLAEEQPGAVQVEEQRTDPMQTDRRTPASD